MDITSKVIEYIKEQKTDYAIMISGEWGVGKTYFIKKALKDIEKEGKRVIYVSLIGVSSDEHLEKKIFGKINPFYNHGKSEITRESEYLESLAATEKQEDVIPKNIVLILDDLERIDQHYFGSAMGYLNTFIEHYNTKCIFACYEEELTSKVIPYSTIKEKYIRYTYSYKADFETVITEKISTNKYRDIISIEEVIRIFEKGETFNIRTLFYALSLFYTLAEEVEKLEPLNRRDEVIQLILNYICFYSIEFKRGIPWKVLDKITVATYDFISQKTDPKTGLVISKENQSDEVDNLIREIQNKYFRNNAIRFEYFRSIGRYIVTGDLSIDGLQNDIKRAQEILENNYLKDRDRRISNILSLSNNSYKQEIETLINYAENGEISLSSYYQLFSVLLYLKSHNLQGFKDINQIRRKFEKGLVIISSNKNQIYIPNIESQMGRKPEKGYEQLEKLRRLIIQTNNALYDNNKFKEEVIIFDLIVRNKDKELFRNLSNKENFNLTARSAETIFQALKEADTRVVISFRDSLAKRYKKYGNDGIIFQTRKYEMEFIMKLHELLNNDLAQYDVSGKRMSDVQLSLLRDDLIQIIDEENKDNE